MSISTSRMGVPCTVLTSRHEEERMIRGRRFQNEKQKEEKPYLFIDPKKNLKWEVELYQLSCRWCR